MAARSVTCEAGKSRHIWNYGNVWHRVDIGRLLRVLLVARTPVL